MSTQYNRQDAVKELARPAVRPGAGGRLTQQLQPTAGTGLQSDTPAYLIDRAEDIDTTRLDGIRMVGLTAGASAPGLPVNEVIEKLKERGATSARTLSGREENVTFSLSKSRQIITPFERPPPRN
ncbi:hypothetical protein [Sedimenticola hydrogenitrophicus]|uniref:hypothetical protein n=1 Tax=Sedimenticola hydrogenitrophicus TaxID=2967975 RepID=UPI0023B109FD|nr:hypothetical protein [Sedimenticola hydrogenitrophicus]